MMKYTLLATMTAVAACSPSAFSQTGGPLTPPPGPPQQAMKSLDQVEPRTPLIDGAPGVSIAASGTITISQSGSYYLTNNLNVTSGHGIMIDASGVTLDLCGFTITSSDASTVGNGISIKGGNITVHNGSILSGTTYDADATEDQFTGPGFSSGIYASSFEARNIHIFNVSVSGCDYGGIFLTYTQFTVIESCSVNTVGNSGIRAGIVRNSSALTCGGLAINAKIADGCEALSTANVGIKATVVTNSRANSFGSTAISATTVSHCYGWTSSTSNLSHGISATIVRGSYGSSSDTAGGDGIRATTVTDSVGTTSGTLATSDGIEAKGAVANCSGTSGGGDGIRANTVMNSNGETAGTSAQADGINAALNASYCFGHSNNAGGGDGIRTTIAVFSTGIGAGTDPGTAGIQALRGTGCYTTGGEAITHKYLMP